MTLPLHVSDEISHALAANKPVVALESTIITHGMPFPANVETARQVEQAVRSEGAVPATIAVLEGRLVVGLSDMELTHLAQEKNVAKLSRADLAVCMANKGTGATTVAATMIAAHLAGIAVFATGGIGGVHKGAETSFDISADLQELAQTPVAVVAAGPKAILDIPKTLEVLETLGVPVMTVGQDEIPAFWSRSSGLASPLKISTAEEVAGAIVMRQALGLKGGSLIANPIPKEHEIPADELAPVISKATAEADSGGISAKELTPFLLQRIFELTDGRSLEANIALVLNNARFAAKIAQELCSRSENT